LLAVVVAAVFLGVMEVLVVVVLVVLFITQEDLFLQAQHILFLLVLVESVLMVRVDKEQLLMVGILF
jgi:hypothetical protein